LAIKEDILKEIISACRQTKDEITKEDIKELNKQLDYLKKAVSKKEIEIKDEKSKKYWESAKMGKAYFIHGLDSQGKRSTEEGSYGRTLSNVLEAITKILDILRGEPLTITIQKTQRNSEGKIIKIETYKGRESDLTLRYNSKYRQVEYDLKESAKALKRMEDFNNAYVNHYANFYKIANEHIKSTRSNSSATGWKKKVNEGNIVEAYQRHLKMKHSLTDETNIDLDSNDFTVQEVLILLYYSVGNTPWWQQGDIGYNQIKQANNLKLASEASIQRVASKILDLFSEPSNFNVKEFNELFTAQDQEQLVNFSELQEEEVQRLLKEIEKTGRFKVKGVNQKTRK